jgi:hypothetical protein
MRGAAKPVPPDRTRRNVKVLGRILQILAPDRFVSITTDPPSRCDREQSPQ